jgi:CMP-N-acetylneuraminic acid synthetase
MYKGKTIIGIIPARSGSKGLPHKNIRPFAGKPLMAWTILAALESGLLDEVFVSTDSAGYASVAKQYGASVPFLRPAVLSGDDCPAGEYIVHAISEYRNKFGQTFDYFILLQPTSPLRTAAHIADGVRMAVDGGLTSVVSFSPFKTDPRLICSLPDDLRLVEPDPPLLFGHRLATACFPNNTLRQGAMQSLYIVNGMIYMCLCSEYERSKSFYGPGGKAMIINDSYPVDIDDETGFLFAELLAKRSGRFG